MVAYKLVPVSSYKDLERAKEQLVIKDEDVILYLYKNNLISHSLYSWYRFL